MVQSMLRLSPRSRRLLTVGSLWLVAGLLVTAVGCGEDPQRAAPAAGDVTPETTAAIPHQGRAEDGFAGSAACVTCHEDQHASWHRSYHRTMTQAASAESIRADFDGRDIVRTGGAWRIEKDDSGHYVRRRAPERPGTYGPRRRVVMVTGSHHQQVYWLEAQPPSREPEMLPFVYHLEEKRWIPREDAFIVAPDHGAMASRWNDGCIRCHATGGQPRQDPGTQAFDTRVAELGIACEACHGPGAEHVAWHRTSPAKRTGPPARDVVNPLLLPQVRQAQVCGQCHAASGPPSLASDVLWLADGYTYLAGDDLWATRGISRHPAKVAKPAAKVPAKNFPMADEEWQYFFWPDGQIRVSGREYNGLLESACYQRGEMTCLTCHSMHDSKPNDQLRPEGQSNAMCLDCHETIRQDVAAHTHHKAGSAGNQCVNCHMPHTTWGLGKAIRSHEISSPSLVESLGRTRRPNACNLCHLDKSLAWAGTHLADWYGHELPAKLPGPAKTMAASLIWLHKGDAGQRALVAWHMGWPGARQTSGADWLIPHLSIAAAGDPYAAVRHVAERALGTNPDAAAPGLDFLAPQAERTAAGKALYERWKALLPGPERAQRTRQDLLFRPDGTLDEAAVMRLQKARDNRRMFLAE